MTHVAKSIKFFAKDECGAATVDWVVVASVLTALGLSMTNTLTDALTSHSSDLRDDLYVGQFTTAWDAHIPVQPDMGNAPMAGPTP